MALPENGRRKRRTTNRADDRGFTVSFPPDLFARAKRHKNEREITEERKVPWTEIMTAALEDYLKKKGA